MQLLYCSLSVYLLLFTASYYLHSPILWSVCLSLWSVIFKATNDITGVREAERSPVLIGDGVRRCSGRSDDKLLSTSLRASVNDAHHTIHHEQLQDA